MGNSIFGKRALAYLIDLAVVYVVTVTSLLLCVFAYGAWQYAGDSQLLKALVTRPSTRTFALAAHFVIYFAYFTLSHWYAGHTLGKWITGLRVQTKFGELTLARSLARSFAYLLSGQLSLGIGALLPLFRKDGRTLHDILLNTDVVNVKAPASTPDQADKQAA